MGSSQARTLLPTSAEGREGVYLLSALQGFALRGSVGVFTGTCCVRGAPRTGVVSG